MNYKTAYNIKNINSDNLTGDDNLNHTKIIAYKDNDDELDLQPLLCLNRDGAIEWCDFLNKQNTKNHEDYLTFSNEMERLLDGMYKDTLNLEYLYKHLLDEYIGDEQNLSQYIKRKGYKGEYDFNLKAIRNRIKNMMETIGIEKGLSDSVSSYELMFRRKNEDYWDDEI